MSSKFCIKERQTLHYPHCHGCHMEHRCEEANERIDGHRHDDGYLPHGDDFILSNILHDFDECHDHHSHYGDHHEDHHEDHGFFGDSHHSHHDDNFVEEIIEEVVEDFCDDDHHDDY